MNTMFIKTRMYQLEVTQKAIADNINLTESQFSKIINGKGNPTLDTLKKIAKELKCNPGALLAKTMEE